MRIRTPVLRGERIWEISFKSMRTSNHLSQQFIFGFIEFENRLRNRYLVQSEWQACHSLNGIQTLQCEYTRWWHIQYILYTTDFGIFWYLLNRSISVDSYLLVLLSICLFLTEFIMNRLRTHTVQVNNKVDFSKARSNALLIYHH